MTYPQSTRGFTLIELMIAVAIVAILASISYPSFAQPLYKARRIDGSFALLQLQMAQERWRADHSSYATLQELKASATSTQKLYTLSVSDAQANSFAVTATAQGTQAGDTACKVLRLSADKGSTTYSSGPDETAGNDSAANRRCWNL